VQAGFSLLDAKEIATGDEAVDEGSYWPAPHAVAWAILKGDSNASCCG
jgi:hypothetical protein